MPVSASMTSTVSTQFGKVPVGSVLSVQCPTIPSDFVVYCNVDTSQETEVAMHIYPEFPLILDNDSMSEFLQVFSPSKVDFLEKLKITKADVDIIEKKTTEQANIPDWFKYREKRFTASRNNRGGL